MKKKGKIIGNGLFLILVFGFTLYGVFHGEDLGEIFKSIDQADNRFLAGAIACVLVFIWGESIVIHYLMKTLNVSLKPWKCFLVSSVGFFFSCITPSASGGQPMQMVFMKKEKVPIPVSSLVLMIVTITYKLVLVMIGIFLLVFQREFVNRYLQNIMPVFYIGLMLNVVCVSVLLLLVFHPLFMRTIVSKGYNLAVRFRLIKRRSKTLQKLDDSMDLYNETAQYLKKNFWLVVNVFIITFFQRIILFMVTYFVYRSFGLKGTSIYDLVMLQAAIAVAVDMLPLPGGMGISEKLFTIIFAPVFGVATLLPGMILCRGLSYYTELIVSACMTVVAQFTMGKKKKVLQAK